MQNRFWDQYYPGGTYDPKVRIAQTPVKKATTASTTKLAASTAKKAPAATTIEKNVGAARVKPSSGKTAAAAAGPHGADLVDEYQKIASDLTSQVSFYSIIPTVYLITTNHITKGV